MDLPCRRRWPAVVLGLVGVVLLVGSLATVGWLAFGPSSPSYTHSVTEVDSGDCDTTGYAQYNYSDLSPEAKRVVDESLSGGGDTVVRDDPVPEFDYPRDVETVRVNQYVRKNGSCFEVATGGGDPSGAGTLVVGGIAIATLLVGGVGGPLLMGLAAVGYRRDPRVAATATLAGVALVVAAAVPWPSAVSGVVVGLAVSSPLPVWVALTGRGWAGTDSGGWTGLSTRLRRVLAASFGVFLVAVVVGLGDPVVAAVTAGVVGTTTLTSYRR